MLRKLLSAFRKPAGRKKEARRFRPRVEGLEQRDCPSTSYYWVGNSGLNRLWSNSVNWQYADGTQATDYPRSRSDIAIFDSRATTYCQADTSVEIDELHGSPPSPIRSASSATSPLK